MAAVAAWQQGISAAEIAAAAAAAAASRQQRGVGSGTNNQQSNKSSNCSGNKMATMTATAMTMETKATAATCCCLRRRRRRQCRGIAKLLPPLPSWQLSTRCRRASAATAAFGRTAGDNKESSGRCNQQPPLPQRRFCRNRWWVRALPTIPPTPF